MRFPILFVNLTRCLEWTVGVKNRQAFPCGKCCATWWIDPIPASVLPWMRSSFRTPHEEKKPEKIHEHVSKRAVWIEGVKFSQLACDAIAMSTPGDPRGKTTTWVVQDTAAAERRKWPLGTQNGSGFDLDVTVWWLSCTTFCQLKWRLNMLNRDLEIQTWSQSNYHCCWVASPSSTDLAVA